MLYNPWPGRTYILVTCYLFSPNWKRLPAFCVCLWLMTDMERQSMITGWFMPNPLQHHSVLFSTQTDLILATRFYLKKISHSSYAIRIAQPQPLPVIPQTSQSVLGLLIWTHIFMSRWCTLMWYKSLKPCSWSSWKNLHLRRYASTYVGEIWDM